MAGSGWRNRAELGVGVRLAGWRRSPRRASSIQASGTPPAGSPPSRRILSRISRDFWKSSSTCAFSAKRPLAVHGDLLVDPRDQVIERIAIVGGLAVEVHVNRVGVRLGVGSPGGRLREGPRRDPGGTVQLEGSLISIQRPGPARPERPARGRPCR